MVDALRLRYKRKDGTEFDGKKYGAQEEHDHGSPDTIGFDDNEYLTGIQITTGTNYTGTSKEVRGIGSVVFITNKGEKPKCGAGGDKNRDEGTLNVDDPSRQKIFDLAVAASDLYINNLTIYYQ